MWTKYEGTSDPEVTFYSTREFNELDYASTPMSRRLAASIAPAVLRGGSKMTRFSKTLQFVGALAVLATLPACDTLDELLVANNPERISEDALNDVLLVDVLTNSVIGEFSAMYDNPFIWTGSMMTDEQVTGINWEQTARINQRLVRYYEGPTDGMFSDLSAARVMADSAAGTVPHPDR